MYLAILRIALINFFEALLIFQKKLIKIFLGRFDNFVLIKEEFTTILMEKQKITSKCILLNKVLEEYQKEDIDLKACQDTYNTLAGSSIFGHYNGFVHSDVMRSKEFITRVCKIISNFDSGFQNSRLYQKPQIVKKNETDSLVISLLTLHFRILGYVVTEDDEKISIIWVKN